MKSLRERIATEQAVVDGETVEYKSEDNKLWRPLGENIDQILFEWGDYDYRIKPEPLEFWINVYEGVNNVHVHSTEYLALAAADDACIKTIKAVEVL